MSKFFSFLNPTSLFDPTPGSNNHYYLPLVILFTILIVIGIILKKYLQKQKNNVAIKKLFKKPAINLITLGIVGLVLLGIRYENLPYLSMRFFIWILIIITAYTIIKTLYLYIKKYPVEKEKLIKTVEKNKYLPKKKK